MSISPAQCRGARGLLGWSQSDLSEASKTATKTIADFERGAREASFRVRLKMCGALSKRPELSSSQKTEEDPAFVFGRLTAPGSTEIKRPQERSYKRSK